MGRPPAPEPPISYNDWLKAGKPPIMVAQAKLGPWLDPPVTKQRIYQLVANETIVTMDGMLDTHHPVNAEWLRSREGGYAPPRPPGRSAAVRANGGSAGETYDHYATTRRPRPSTEPTGGGDMSGDVIGINLEEILDAIENMDLTKLPAAQVDKIRKLEVAFKTRTERMQKRGQLIDRGLVASVFGKLYMIDTNQLRTVGAKLAPNIAGRFGAEDPAAQLEVEKIIDDEITKVLVHIHRELNDFLVSIGAGGGLSE